MRGVEAQEYLPEQIYNKLFEFGVPICITVLLWRRLLLNHACPDFQVILRNSYERYNSLGFREIRWSSNFPLAVVILERGVNVEFLSGTLLLYLPSVYFADLSINREIIGFIFFYSWTSEAG